MKQTLFETRQQAEELLRESISIWRKSDQSEYLEGIEKDPVFSLLMTALAYQSNEINSEIERLKTEVLDEFARMLVPYEIGHATPATAIIETVPQENVPEVKLDEHFSFTLNNSAYTFIPLLKSRVLNATVSSIVRLDARRWKVSLQFKSPVSDLSGFSFAITNPDFQDLRVSLNGKLMPLIKPWDYSNLPLSNCFALDTMLYNRSQTFNASAACLDLFAKQNVRMFCVKRHNPEKFILMETEKIDLIFEFMGISNDFLFDKTFLSLNSVVLVNAGLYSANLSSDNPIVRIAGYNATTPKEEEGKQFLHLVRPLEEQIYSNANVEVRHVMADRFNQGGLVKLLNSLINKFDSDFYAFQQNKELYDSSVIQQLKDILSHLLKVSTQNPVHSISGVYLLLKRNELQKENISVDVSYLATNGALVNPLLDEKSTFGVPLGLDVTATRQIAPPVYGNNEIQNVNALNSLARYYMVTNDRIVTPADMKTLCYNELMIHYGIIPDMIDCINVSHRQEIGNLYCGYEILVEIIIKDNSFVKRSFADKVLQAELWLQKMMEVRSTNIYPIRVNIQID